jgi:hypothetical protein
MSFKFISVGSLGEQQLVKNQDHHKEMIVPRLEWGSRFLALPSPYLQRFLSFTHSPHHPKALPSKLPYRPYALSMCDILDQERTIQILMLTKTAHRLRLDKQIN